MIIVRPFKVRSTRLTLSEAVSRGSEKGDLDEAFLEADPEGRRGYQRRIDELTGEDGDDRPG